MKASHLKALFATVAAVAIAGTAMAQGTPPNPAKADPAVGAGQRSTQNTPMGTTGTPAGGSTGSASTTSNAGSSGSSTTMGAGSTSGSSSTAGTSGSTTGSSSSMGAGSTTDMSASAGTGTGKKSRRARADRG